jgi:hypothetical protein
LYFSILDICPYLKIATPVRMGFAARFTIRTIAPRTPRVSSSKSGEREKLKCFAFFAIFARAHSEAGVRAEDAKDAKKFLQCSSS